jgi:hypothetical protein
MLSGDRPDLGRLSEIRPEAGQIRGHVRGARRGVEGRIETTLRFPSHDHLRAHIAALP